MNDSAAGADDTRGHSLLFLALGTIVLSLILLVTVPVVVQRRIDRIRTRMVEVVDSAHREANEVAYALAREMALLRGFVVEDDPALLREYGEMRVREARAMQRLGGLTPHLPDEVRQRVAGVRMVLAHWHHAVEEELRARSVRAGPASGSDRVFARPLHEAALAASVRLNERLAATRDEALRRVARAERYGLALTSALALLALLSTALVVWLGRRLRVYAERARREHEAALRANEARARLMRGLTHDLKSPLSAVSLYSDVLEMETHGPLTAEQNEVVGRIRALAQQVLGLLGDLLELSQAEAGLLRLERSAVALAPLLHEVIDHHTGSAAAAGIAIHVDSPLDGPIIRADARRVRQIFDNLVGNAIKYTPRGGAIGVRSRRAGEGPRRDAEGWVAVEVEDTGPGIALNDQDHVFEEFVRLPGARSQQDGSGIGLAISRHLARLTGGDITLRSEPGEGSIFTLWLPSSGSSE